MSARARIESRLKDAVPDPPGWSYATGWREAMKEALAIVTRAEAEDGIDPAVVFAVVSRAYRAIRAKDAAHEVLPSLDALALEAHDLIVRRGPVRGGPFQGHRQPLPSWWREEYRDDPLLSALAHMGAPASVALPMVIAALWEVRGVLMGAAMRATPSIRIEAPPGWKPPKEGG